ncbi:MAG: adenosine deaminase [Deltaproteobacteria bacterium]|nr:adenosine deaminase [Deltaproteobacteria bacterium]
MRTDESKNRKRTELHRHLDVSFRASTLADLVKTLGISAPFHDEEEVRTKFWVTRQMGSLGEVLSCFGIFQQVLRTPAILERVAREVIEDAGAEGIGAIELRYSPSFTSKVSGLSWGVALDAFLRGLEAGARATGVNAGLICIVTRDYGVGVAGETIDFAIQNKDAFLAVDLAGNEEQFPNKMFVEPFRRARDAGLHVTIHAGEACGPESVWDALDLLGAQRIGHGISSVKDAELMKRLARDGVLLEICPTSNFVTRSIPSWDAHPLKRFLDAGIPVSLSTDDPGIFGVTLEEEYQRARRLLGLSDADFDRIDRYARKYTFL